MKIPLNKLKTCPINSQIYIDGNVDDLINSIEEFGLIQPLVITPDNLIVSGHRRYKAMKALGWKNAECDVKKIAKKDLLIKYVINGT